MAAPKWTTADIPDQTGRVAVVTGANTGLGRETARALAIAGAEVILAVRDTGKGAAATADIRAKAPTAKLHVQKLDLGSLASIHAASDDLHAAHPRIDLLINNAGVMYPPYGVTEDGFELQFGINHLGHFALTGLLLDTLTDVPGSRIVTVSSIGHRVGADIHFDDLQWTKKYKPSAAYAQSKLANLLFAYGLQHRLTAKKLPTISLGAHPGGAGTDLQRHSPMMRIMTRVGRSAAQGAEPTLRAATDPDAHGEDYYGPLRMMQTTGPAGRVDSSELSHDRALQDRLWTVSEELTGVDYAL
ncbi:oxidoreductase [Microbacterium sp. RURRCA19A]|uniref:oxidoreductase n=1 Tax=Microbacterium sp. RURRCA19A TaxID=1907391 RepID=UPI000955240A|nr:oxidoreductase [Microbacterium sp. RURRCA19A]SIR56295.1 NAD(P)-dependent dehydrogenase, short-chain alcohol dehydrogenase family [Microbacterium sp. RURRCA19A]